VAAYPYDTGAGTTNTAHIYKALQEVAKTGLWCAIHPFNKDIFDEHIRDQEKAGTFTDKYAFWKGMYSDEEMVSAAHMLRYLAKKAGVKYYMLHCTLLEYVALAREAKAAGETVIADSGWSGFVPPPTKEEAGRGLHILRKDVLSERMARWKACLEGTIDFIDTDHAPHLLDEIDTEDPRKAAAGYPAYPHHFSLLLTEVNKGVYQLVPLIKFMAENPAKIFNIFPRKGAIQVGSDADLVIVDMKKEGTISTEGLYTKCDWYPFMGRRVKGMPVCTILRGTVIAKEGRVIGKPGFGRFIKPEKPKP
jgi:dihydroorotase/allantoinase